ncbi:MAG: hypothetical protein AAFX99_37055, partial [Myxococcota bacterium]
MHLALDESAAGLQTIKLYCVSGRFCTLYAHVHIIQVVMQHPKPVLVVDGKHTLTRALPQETRLIWSHHTLQDVTASLSRGNIEALVLNLDTQPHLSIQALTVLSQH